MASRSVSAPTTRDDAAATRRPITVRADLPSWPLLDPEDLFLLRLEILGGDHAVVAKLRELLELGRVVATARVRNRWGRRGLGGLFGHIRRRTLTLVRPALR